jgi:hypothetical protein
MTAGCDATAGARGVVGQAVARLPSDQRSRARRQGTGRPRLMIVPKFSGTSVESAAAIARAAAIGMLPVSRQINRPKRVVSLQRRQAPGGFV